MRKVFLAAALSLAAIAGCSKSPPGSAPAGTNAQAQADIPAMTVDELDHELAAKQATPVDCNPESTRKHEGVVPGAILLTDEASYAPSELPADKTTKLVFYCANPG